jgi:hypothetical protein
MHLRRWPEKPPFYISVPKMRGSWRPEPILPATCEATRGFGLRGDYAYTHALPLRPSPPIGQAC